jgi:glycosyltransferase involved in cell wall biosynthesis
MPSTEPQLHNDRSRSTDSLASVIIPTYNHAQYLGDAISSALQQTYKHVEIIIVDDGSTDNTKEVVSKFGDRVRYIWQENRGLSAARNTGIEAATGKMIGLLDADDLYEPGFLATLIPILNSNPMLDGVFCAARTIDTNNNLLPQHIGQAVRPEELRGKLLNGGFFPPLCMFVRKYCYEESGQLFDESLTALEDWDMWLRFSQRYKILGIDEPLVRYRIVPGSMSRHPERMSSNRSAVIQKHFVNEPADSSSWTLTHRRAVGHSLLRTTIEFLQAHDRKQARQYLRQAFNTCPDLAYRVDVFYELSLGDQPQGYRGTPHQLDLEENALGIHQMLHEIFKPPVVPDLEMLKNIAYGTAHCAIGLLAYNTGQPSMSRFHLFKSLRYRPELWRDKMVLGILMRTFFGPKGLTWLRELRRSRQQSKIA